MPDTQISEEMCLAAADAMERVEVGYHLQLVKLVDGVHTYTLTYDDATGPLEFTCTEDAYAHIAAKRRESQARAALTAALSGHVVGWRTMDSAPKDERILVYNELWDETHGAHQIATLDYAGTWQFDSELCIDGITEDDIEASEDEPLTPEDFKPQKWQPLPAPPVQEMEQG